LVPVEQIFVEFYTAERVWGSQNPSRKFTFGSKTDKNYSHSIWCTHI